MPTHIVKQGEYLAQIARDYGLSTWQQIWGHSDNSALRAKRKNPNVLMPGDRLFVPELETKDVSVPSDARHSFRKSGSLLMLRVVFRDLDDKPIADTPCDLQMGTDVLHMRTDGGGRIEVEIAPGIANATVVFERNVSFDIAIPLEIGALDPVEEPSGQRERLNNLGYFAGDASTSEEPGDETARQAQFQSALEEFQCDQGLKVDGKCGSQTQTRLKQVYGC